MKNKICPILTARSEAYNIDCMQENCSLFSSRNCCALLMLAEAADSACSIDENLDRLCGDLADTEDVLRDITTALRNLA